jgi:CubicO group peptidase (beta-lactamase class C family)
MSAMKAIFAAVLIGFVAVSAAAQDAARMDQVVQSYVPARFMGTVLVARGDAVVLSKAYGVANLEWNVPNTPATKFRLGSLTKQFTAASILLLEERGKLKVDEPVKTYLPDAPAAWDKITIFNLLTHSSGIPNFTSFPDYAATQAFATPAEKIVARFRDKPLDFAPGEKMSYSNSGYVLLGYLIERITGGSYATFVQDNIFTPLGMKDSGYDSNSALILRRVWICAEPDRSRERRLHSHEHSARRRGSLLDDRGPVEMAAGAAWRPCGVGRVPAENDDAVQGRLRVRSGCAHGQRPEDDRARRRDRGVQHRHVVFSRREAQHRRPVEHQRTHRR